MRKGYQWRYLWIRSSDITLLYGCFIEEPSIKQLKEYMNELNKMFMVIRYPFLVNYVIYQHNTQGLAAEFYKSKADIVKQSVKDISSSDIPVYEL